jgi:hypothetical protein
MSERQDWRLKAELNAVDTCGALDHLLGRLRGPDVAPMVLVNEPGVPSHTVKLPPMMRDLDGDTVGSSVTLAPASGIVLKGL